MNPFAYSRPDSVDSAIDELVTEPAAKFIGGGTNLIDLMKENIEKPSRLVDINRLPLTDIVELPDGGLRLGALVNRTAAPQEYTVQRTILFTHTDYGLSPVWVSRQIVISNRETVPSELLIKFLPDETYSRSNNEGNLKIFLQIRGVINNAKTARPIISG
ncbi:MAG: hypothetical protein EOO39_26995 [Cytophagaceae bacterium]|nr:MAG: hypothetical protein EOO39_26995 [Cytophagaceae bacterium]